MINVTFTESGKKLSLRLEGHAGYADVGKDLVCASASILAYTLAYIVQQEDETADIRLDSGDTVIECVKTPTIRTAFEHTLIGLGLLEQNYPQYVKLNALT
jgi:uncharacterized protein YsxB (DUF464 family)